MDLNRVFDRIDNNRSAYVELLRTLCSFEGRAADKADIDKMADYVTAFAEKAGFAVRRTPFSKCGDFLTIDLNPGAPKHSVMLAHMDTVHPKGSFGTPAVRIENGRMIGPGTIDCKGGIAIALLCMKALSECGYKRHVRLLLTTDEEVSNVLGGEAEQAFFCNESAGFAYALNCETTKPREVVVSRKGILRYRITVRGKGGHAGIAYFDCRNPVVEAAHKILALEQSSDPQGATFSCNVIQAGSASNVIPDLCSFTVDVRVHTHAQAETADRLVHEIAAKSFLGDTVSEAVLLGRRPPMEKTPQTMALFDRLNALSTALELGELIPVSSGGGSDSAYTQAAGITSLCGLGAEGDFCHTDREYAEIDSIARRAKLLSALLFEEV